MSEEWRIGGAVWRIVEMVPRWAMLPVAALVGAYAFLNMIWVPIAAVATMLGHPVWPFGE